MNPFKFLLFSGAGYLSLVMIFGSPSESPPETTVRVPQTVQILPLTQQQEADREAEILQQMAEENASIYDEPVETTTTLPQLAQIDPDTKCQEWLPLAVEMGWPNETHVLQRLGQVMWKESRCQPQACSKSDSDRQCRDYGLTQGNWYAHNKWWTGLGISPQDMFDPATNLRWAYLLYSGREEQGKCGWQPWSLPC